MQASISACRRWLAAIVVLVLVLAIAPVASAVTPGPGPHWIDTATAGLDIMPTEAFFGVDVTFDGLPEFDVLLTGPTIVQRSAALDDSVAFPGLRPLEGHLDVIDTEIVAMSLTGGGMTLRAGTGEGLGTPSLGAVAEWPADPFLADSFFDVFFEIDVNLPVIGLVTLHNQDPLRVDAVVDRLPPLPGTVYVIGPVVVPLFTITQDHVANLTQPAGGGGHHKITPLPAAAWAGLILLGSLGTIQGVRRRRRG